MPRGKPSYRRQFGCDSLIEAGAAAARASLNVADDAATRYSPNATGGTTTLDSLIEAGGAAARASSNVADGTATRDCPDKVTRGTGTRLSERSRWYGNESLNQSGM